MHSLGRDRESAAANSVHDQDEPVDHFTSLCLSLNLSAGAPALESINAPGLVEGGLMDARIWWPCSNRKNRLPRSRQSAKPRANCSTTRSARYWKRWSATLVVP